jgi:predicted GNAT superfamily acetyltransferase
MTSLPIVIRDITDLAGCRAAVQVQEAVWGRDGDTVPASLLSVSIKRGGILIGAFDGSDLAGFVWSMPAVRDGQPTQWSHMLGVRPAERRSGLGATLKRAQRDRAIALGVELIEWTFDPLQAANAHLNIARLGAISSTYVLDAYGEMAGPLHRGTPTDRLIAEWWVSRPHVERRLSRASLLTARAADVVNAEAVIRTRQSGEWVECAGVDQDVEAPRVVVAVPPRFTEMQRIAPEIALAWRLAVRAAMSSRLASNYRVVDFFFNRDSGGGDYLLARQ